MYTADLHAFLANVGGESPVDLLKIGQNSRHQSASSNKKNKQNHKFRVALDIEDCLDRFYGGYYSDWACGGQWNRAYQFVQLLGNAFNSAYIEVVVFFDGTSKKNKKLTNQRNDFRQKTNSVLKHIRMIGTPPPKIWWLPPSGIHTTLRNAFRSINIQIVQTINDHTMEVLEYFSEHKLDAIIGLHNDYIIANASRYFSSHDLRLSYKGSLETKEFLHSKLLSALSLSTDHLPYLAPFLGDCCFIGDSMLKKIYETLSIDSHLDLESKIRKIAVIVRNTPTNNVIEFIKHLNLTEFQKEIKTSVEYYQRKEKFCVKKTNSKINKKKNSPTESKIIESTPLASESNTDNDDIACKVINNVNHLVDQEAPNVFEASKELEKLNIKQSKSNGAAKKASSSFLYTLPGEVLKTSLNRHQRGIMDPKIYQLLTNKEIILPQILEDERYREIPSIHIFYRPARQMIYAILFNMYHQKYLCSKQNSNDKKNEKKDKSDSQSQKPPEIFISEWIWSPNNEYKKPELVPAQILPWAVPTIQRLWFGMAFEDKQRRMRAFLTIMRSDSPLMLNRGYVPQHMLVLACVLRYIVTSPDRSILTRQELDAFLATAFSQQLSMVEYTQELVLPGVHLRGVFLATLFMQGVETASLANDSCGVPLPWTMTNPWVFFDGKLFHLKLKMSTYTATLRELCDDHIEVVLKIERFRKAILEDVEQYLLPTAHIDPMYRPGFLPPPLSIAYNKSAGFHHLSSATANVNSAIFYNSPTQLQTPPYFSPSTTILGRSGMTTNVNNGLTNRNSINRSANSTTGVLRVGTNNHKGYQLKVGGIVTGSWAAGGFANRSIIGYPINRLTRAGNINLPRLTGRVAVNSKLARSQQHSLTNRSIPKFFGAKLNSRNRTKQKRRDNKKTKLSKKENKNSKKDNKDDKTDTESIMAKVKNISKECTVELQNGITVLASTLIKADNKLVSDDSVEDIPKNKEQDSSVISVSQSSSNSIQEDDNIGHENILKTSLENVTSALNCSENESAKSSVFDNATTNKASFNVGFAKRGKSKKNSEASTEPIKKNESETNQIIEDIEKNKDGDKDVKLLKA